MEMKSRKFLYLTSLSFIVLILFNIAARSSQKKINNKEPLKNQSALAFLDWDYAAICYHPRNHIPGDDEPEENFLTEQVEKDLSLLRKYGFRSIVTYSATSNFDKIPRIARENGFDGFVIMGIWDPADEQELKNAVAQDQYINGYCVGNEGLGVRYNTDTLEAAFKYIRENTDKPVTTTEPIDSYFEGEYHEWLTDHSDWIFPLAQPFWAQLSDPKQAADWIRVRFEYLITHQAKPVQIKEAGLPSAGFKGLSENYQLDHFRYLETTGIPFLYFEAFDQPWKVDKHWGTDVEKHWGLFRKNGEPKIAAMWLHENNRKL